MNHYLFRIGTSLSMMITCHRMAWLSCRSCNTCSSV